MTDHIPPIHPPGTIRPRPRDRNVRLLLQDAEFEIHALKRRVDELHRGPFPKDAVAELHASQARLDYLLTSAEAFLRAVYPDSFPSEPNDRVREL